MMIADSGTPLAGEKEPDSRPFTIEALAPSVVRAAAAWAREANRQRRAEEAEDIASEAVIRLLTCTRRVGFEFESPEKFFSLLRKIVFGIAVDHSRADGRRNRCIDVIEVDDLPDLGQVASDDAIDMWEHEAVWGFIKTNLNRDQRTALDLRYIAELSFEDCAQVMQRSPESVKGLVQRGMDAIRMRFATKPKAARASRQMRENKSRWRPEEVPSVEC